MKIVNKNINEIKPYDKNPRNNDNAVEAVANSIKEFGFKVPIVIDKDGVIIAGHTRWKASQKLGLTQVPCIVADDLNEKQIQAFRIAENKTSELAEWNDDLLGDELKELFDDFDMTEFGFGDFEMTILTEDLTPESYDDEVINEYTKTSDEFLKSKRIILTFQTEEEEEFIKKLLKIETTGVVYKVKDLMVWLDEDN